MPDYAACETVFDVNAYIERCLDAPMFGIDTETTGTARWHDELVGICLSAAPGEGRYIPIAHTGDDAPNVPLSGIAASLGHLLSTRPSVFHNAPFDVFMLWRYLRDHGVADPWTWPIAFDTQLAAQCSGHRSEGGNDKSAGLKALAKLFLGVDRPTFDDMFPPKTKDKDKKFSRLDVDIAVPYAAADADDTLSLVEPLRAEMLRHDVKSTFDLEMNLLPEMIWMEHRGVVIDHDVSVSMEQRAVEFAEKVEDAVVAYFAERIGTDTIEVPRKRKGEQVHVEEKVQFKDAHFKVILHDVLKLPVMGETPAGNVSINEDALVKLADHEPACAWILEARGARKAANTYFVGWRKNVVIEGDEHIIHPQYRQYGTETGRESSSDPNVQNAPKEQIFGEEVQVPGVDPITVNVRDTVKPRPGFYFMEMDWAQVEARVIAGYSQEPTLLDVFNRGIDYHKATYAAMYGVTPDSVTKEQRKEGKTLNYALGFGGGAELIAGMLGCSVQEAQEKVNRYWAGLPHYAAWKAEIEEFADKHRFVSTYFGRKRFLDFGGQNVSQKAARAAWFAALREAVNTPVQGTAADLLKIMLVRLGRYLREHLPGIRTVFTTHDSVTLEVPATIDPVWLSEVLDPVCGFPADFIPGWPEIACDFEWGDRWGSLSAEDDDDEVEETSEPVPEIEVAPTAPYFVLDVESSALTEHNVADFRELLTSLGGGDARLRVIVGDSVLEWTDMNLSDGDGVLFSHIIPPEQYRYYPETNLGALV